MKKLRIDIWSDIACPWCYVGKRRLESALADFAHRDEVEIEWHAFELDPSAPPIQPSSNGSYVERLGRKYGMSVAVAEERIAGMTATAAVDGLDFRFDRIRPGNTFDAHRLIHFALEHGKQDAMKERLLRAYLTEGEAIGDREALVRVAAEVGFDANELRAMLEGDAHREAVRADEKQAQALGIRGVPFFVIAERYGVSGAQPSEVLLRALEKARDELRPALETTGGRDAEVCGPDGCAV